MTEPKPCPYSPADEVFFVAVRGDETGCFYDQHTLSFSKERALERAEKTSYRRSSPVVGVEEIRLIKRADVSRAAGIREELLKACRAAVHALRSYQHGNSAPDLAESVADAVEKAIQKAEVPQ
jgi:hypothetical protein